MRRLALTQVVVVRNSRLLMSAEQVTPARYAADKLCTSRIATRRGLIEKNRILLHQGQPTPQICDDVIYADIRLAV